MFHKPTLPVSSIGRYKTQTQIVIEQGGITLREMEAEVEYSTPTTWTIIHFVFRCKKKQSPQRNVCQKVEPEKVKENG